MQCHRVGFSFYLHRQIFPRVKLVSSAGIEEVGDDEIAQVYQGVVDARRRPGA